MKNSEENNDRKSERRNKLNKKHHIKKTFIDDDVMGQQNAKKELKRIKESLEEEEWRDWDQYYNR
jgi:AAA+ superfamily predicted ATPase